VQSIIQQRIGSDAADAGAQGSVQSRLLLQQAVDFEPVGASAVAGAALGHPHQEALAQTTGLARRPVLLVDDALAAVLAVTNGRHVAVSAAEKRFATFAGEGAEVETGSWFSAHFALLIHLIKMARWTKITTTRNQVQQQFNNTAALITRKKNAVQSLG